jgi:DNA-binding NtrC family response regulator
MSHEPAAPLSEIRILLVDDDETFLRVLGGVLAASGYSVLSAHSGAEALARLEKEPADVVLSDLVMPGMDGVELVGLLRDSHPGTPVLLMTAFSEDDEIARGIEAGAVDFLPKGASPRELVARIRRALETRRVLEEIAELRRLRDLTQSRRRKTDLLIGGSEAIQSIYRQIGMLARNDVTVLIEGESGTGKELVARTIHLSGPRAAAPFVVVNCGAIPENLLEDELFGHVRGAFTGAYSDHPGVFEQADGGSVLLDEIGELPSAMQVKLLRFLQTPELRRIGGRRSLRVDVKILAATNRDLEKELRAGRFREDLYYRLKVVPIRVPPLRERREDIPMLVDHFVRTHAPALGRPEPSFAPEAFRKLMGWSWPGNVRELENLVRNLLITIDRPRIEGNDVVLPGQPAPSAPGTIDLSVPLPELRKRVVESLERDYVRLALAEAGGNVSAAARRAGLDRKNFAHLAAKAGVDPAGFRPGGTKEGENGEVEVAAGRKAPPRRSGKKTPASSRRPAGRRKG